MVFALVVVGFLLLGCLFYWWNDIIYALPATFRRSTGGARLPPGYMGLPFIGEMANFLYYFKFLGRPDDFINAKRQKYGGTAGLYRTHLFGGPAIIVCSPAANKFVFKSEANFPMEWPTAEIVGPNSLVAVQGQAHDRIRSFVVRAINQPDALRRIAQMVQPPIVRALHSWAQKGTILGYNEAKKVTFENIGNYFASFEPGPRLDVLDKLFEGMVKGMRSLPVKIPGNAYHYGVQCRRKAVGIFKEELEKRRNGGGVGSKEKGGNYQDLMDGLMELKDEEGKRLSDGEVLDNIVSLVVGGYQSTSLAIMWTLYYLAKYPHVVRKLQEEHATTCKNGEFLTSDDIQKMKYTTKVVEEIIRLANIAFVLFRTAEKDVDYEGFRIPQGWKVICWIRYLHTDPENFEDPLCFNPDRWNEPPKAGSYMVFGGGSRTCAGNMLARLQVAIFIYHLVRGYRWELVNPEAGMSYLPHQKPLDGVEINISRI